MSDAPDDQKSKPIFNPDDSEPSAAPLIDFGTEAQADAAETKADAAAAKADKADAKADKATAKAAAKAGTTATAASGSATGEVTPAAAGSDFAGREVVLRSGAGASAPEGQPRYRLAAGDPRCRRVRRGLRGTRLDPDRRRARRRGRVVRDLHPEPRVPDPRADLPGRLRAPRAAGQPGRLGGPCLRQSPRGPRRLLRNRRGRVRCCSRCRVATCRRIGYLLSQPFIIIAALVAREVSIWIGLAISARGRRVKSRNHEIVDEWEKEHADTRGAV